MKNIQQIHSKFFKKVRISDEERKSYLLYVANELIKSYHYATPKLTKDNYRNTPSYAVTNFIRNFLHIKTQDKITQKKLLSNLENYTILEQLFGMLSHFEHSDQEYLFKRISKEEIENRLRSDKDNELIDKASIIEEEAQRLAKRELERQQMDFFERNHQRIKKMIDRRAQELLQEHNNDHELKPSRRRKNNTDGLPFE